MPHYNILFLCTGNSPKFSALIVKLSSCWIAESAFFVAAICQSQTGWRSNRRSTI
jgi:hypothetical protein